MALEARSRWQWCRRLAARIRAVLLVRKGRQRSGGRARRDTRGDVREQPRFGVLGRSFVCFCLCVRDVQHDVSVR